MECPKTLKNSNKEALNDAQQMTSCWWHVDAKTCADTHKGSTDWAKPRHLWHV